MEMPPLGLLVLDSLMVDHETVETLRDDGEGAPTACHWWLRTL